MSLLLVVVATTASAASATRTIVLGDDRRTDALDLLVLLLYLLGVRLRVRVQPRLPILEGIHDFLLLLGIHLLAEALVVPRTLGRRTHGVDVAIEGVLRVHTLLHLLVLVGELL